MAKECAIMVFCLAAMLPSGGCRARPREPLVTYFNATHQISFRHPWNWRTEALEQDGIWMRRVRPPADAQPGVRAPMPSKPPTGSPPGFVASSDPKPESRTPAQPAPTDAATEGAVSLSATLLFAPAAFGRENLARRFIPEAMSPATEGTRTGARSWTYRRTEAQFEATLLLLQEQDSPHPHQAASPFYGLLVLIEGPAAAVEGHRRGVEDMLASLTLERPALYEHVREDEFGFSLRLPKSWSRQRRLRGEGRLLLQYLSPALAADKGRGTVHASLTLTVETLPVGQDFEGSYSETQARLEGSYQRSTHRNWRGGYADTLYAETALAATRQQRYYLTGKGHMYTLTCASRSDAFYRVSDWCAMIAETVQVAGSPSAARPDRHPPGAAASGQPERRGSSMLPATPSPAS